MPVDGDGDGDGARGRKTGRHGAPGRIDPDRRRYARTPARPANETTLTAQCPHVQSERGHRRPDDRRPWTPVRHRSIRLDTRRPARPARPIRPARPARQFDRHDGRPVDRHDRPDRHDRYDADRLDRHDSSDRHDRHDRPARRHDSSTGSTGTTVPTGSTGTTVPTGSTGTTVRLLDRLDRHDGTTFDRLDGHDGPDRSSPSLTTKTSTSVDDTANLKDGNKFTPDPILLQNGRGGGGPTDEPFQRWKDFGNKLGLGGGGAPAPSAPTGGGAPAAGDRRHRSRQLEPTSRASALSEMEGADARCQEALRFLRLTPTLPHSEKPRIRTHGAPGDPSPLTLWSNVPITPTPLRSTFTSGGTRMVCPPMIE